MVESPFKPAPREPFLRRVLPVSGRLRRYPGKAPRDLVAGMTVGTLFTLFVVPVFYGLIAAEHHRPSIAEEPQAQEPEPLAPSTTAVGIA